MDTTNTIVLTGLVVTLGRWADDKPLDIKLVVGAVTFAVFTSVLDQVGGGNLGLRFSQLLLVGALLTYSPAITKKLVK